MMKVFTFDEHDLERLLTEGSTVLEWGAPSREEYARLDITPDFRRLLISHAFKTWMPRNA